MTSLQSGNKTICIERQLLPQFDDNIERVFGMILLYHEVRSQLLVESSQSGATN